MLLENLIERQAQLGLNDGAFAQEIGVSRSLWVRTRQRHKPISMKILTGIYKRFPDMIPDVLLFLGGRVPVRTLKVSIDNKL